MDSRATGRVECIRATVNDLSIFRSVNRQAILTIIYLNLGDTQKKNAFMSVDYFNEL